MNEFGKALTEWYESDGFKQMQKAQEEMLQKAVGKYHMLSEDDKYDMVQAICHIICAAEQRGTSHRGLMDELGIYPIGFGISELMTIHNAVWTEFQDQDFKKYYAETLKKEVHTLTSLDNDVKLGNPDTEDFNEPNQRRVG
jgi:hypothetical protein